MNAALFDTYAPAIEAFLSSQTDKVCKPWSQVVHLFFEINVDGMVSTWANLAAMFANAQQPADFHISADALDVYFDEFKVTEVSLARSNFTENEDFIVDSEGLRLTFGTVRELTFTKGNPEMMQAFGFIDKIYQMYVRYELAMMNQSKRPTHWTLVERIGVFTQSMQPHIDAGLLKNPEKKPTFLTMNTQPKVYVVVKGTEKTIAAKFKKIRKVTDMNNEDEELKCSSRNVIPIYETVLPSVAEEIDSVLNYIDQTHAIPHRETQLGTQTSDGETISKLNRTKHNVKLLKTAILIDPSQTDYTESSMIKDIEDVRRKLKMGKKTHVPKEKRKAVDPMEGNSMDIKMFERTNGRYVDEFMAIDLSPPTDEVAPTPPSQLAECEIEDDFEEEEEEDDEPPVDTTVPSVVEPTEPIAPVQSTTFSRAPPRRRQRAQKAPEEGEYDEDDQATPVRRGRTNNVLRARSVRANTSKASLAGSNDGYDTSDSE